MGSVSREFRFHEGSLDHKWETSYRRLWMIMKRNIIYIFRDRPYIPENHEGTLTVDQTTKFEVKSEKSNNYKFVLYTSNRRRINTFKSDKKSERDLWRGYIVGVARQKVPDDLDLPRDVINKIKQDVANYHLDNGSPEQFDVISRSSVGVRSSTSSVTNSSSRQSLSGRSNPQRHSVVSGDSGVSVSASVSASQRSRSSGSGSMTIEGTGGGPFMRHKFSNRPDDSIIPSWFFEACTREKAESYLAIAAERGYGDTLMRESTKFKQDGSYVISKRIVREGRSSVEHYEVIRVERGYKIKVENQHEAMRNLTEVMNYFITTAGSHGTTPLTTNRFGDFGMTEDPYNTGRIQISDAATEAEPPPDYEEPIQTQQQPPPPPPLNIRQGYKTVTPSSTKSLSEEYDNVNIHQARHSFNTERHASDDRPKPVRPSLDEIQTNIKTAATLHYLDETIDKCFDEPAREEDYINLRDLKPEDLPRPPPPPPAPHTALPPLPQPHTPRQPSYVNEQPQQQAPALPERPKSVPSFADHLTNAQLNPVLNKKAPTTGPPPSIKHVTSEPVLKPADDTRDSPTPQQLGLRKTKFEKADPSKGEIMRPTGRLPMTKAKSMEVPSDHIPSPQELGLKPTNISKPITESVTYEVNNEPEIDQTHPGGVSSIKSKFEKRLSVSEDNPTSPRQSTGVGTNQFPKPCTKTPDHVYCNNPNQDNDNTYDDARTPVPCGRSRSKSTPTISPEIREQLKVSRMSSGNSSFIKKLEGVLGGQQRNIPATQRPKSIQDSNFSKDTDHDDTYEYLPD